MLINKDKIEAATVYKEHRVEDDSFVEIKYICSNIRKRKTQRGKWMALKTMLHLVGMRFPEAFLWAVKEAVKFWKKNNFVVISWENLKQSKKALIIEQKGCVFMYWKSPNWQRDRLARCSLPKGLDRSPWGKIQQDKIDKIKANFTRKAFRENTETLMKAMYKGPMSTGVATDQAITPRILWDKGHGHFGIRKDMCYDPCIIDT